MQTDKLTTILLILLMSIFLLSGCSSFQKPADVVTEPNPFEKFTSQQQVARRFQESAPQSPTAVESAIELSEKYASLSEEALVLRQQNQDLIAKNNQFKNQITALGAQMQQTQKELTESNDLLIEMRIELNNWKTDILGFRNEMRDSETAQLEALLKILQVLGGQVTVESVKAKNTGSAVASLSKSGQP
jgi:PBP1b-binding outer membrane lipoprotein LpoB